MQKEILVQMLEQNRKDCTYFCKNINAGNSDFRLTEQTASIGFIYRHIGETIHLLAQFFGYKTDVEGTTMGQSDMGKEYDLKTSQDLFERGYKTLEKLVNETSENDWIEEIETPWFGKISRIKLFSIILFHNAHHCGQISSTIIKGQKY